MNKIMQYFENVFHEIKLHTLSIIFYCIVNSVYIAKLNLYNKKLEGLSWLEIMTYNQGSSWYYLFFTIFLAILAVLIIYLTLKNRYNISYIQNWIILFCYLIILIVNCVFLVNAINNPILKSAIIFLLVGGGIISSKS